MDAQRPVPEIREDLIFQHTHKQVNKRDDSNRLRPPKLKTRYYHHDSNFNRSQSMSSAQFITFSSEHSMMCQFPHSSIYNKSNEETYFEQCFSRISKIGEGSFGEVFKVRCKEDGLLYAVKMSKQLFRSENYRQERLEEVKRYEEFSDQENCVRFYKAWEQDDRLYMQMELCRESLEQYVERTRHVPEDKIWSILLDLLLALKSLHDKNLIHLDIKLDNVLIGDDSSCKLADFGLVIDVDKANRHQVTEGDSRYIAPELMQGHFSKAADIFSLGIAILELSCCLELPANGPLWQELRSGILPESFIKDKSIELQTIIKQMMLPQPHLRPTVDDLLNHKRIVSLLQRRSRWKILKKFQQAMRHSRRVAWSKLCNLKKIFFQYVVFLFALFKIPETNTIKPTSVNSVERKKSIHSAPEIVFSTPTIKTYGPGSSITNEINTFSASLFNSSHHSTPTSFTTLKIVNSTPLNHSVRSRKDLTKTSFKTVTNGFDHFPIDKSSSSFLCLDDIETQSCSFVKNSFDTSSLRRKKLFSNNDDSD